MLMYDGLAQQILHVGTTLIAAQLRIVLFYLYILFLFIKIASRRVILISQNISQDSSVVIGNRKETAAAKKNRQNLLFSKLQ